MGAGFGKCGARCKMWRVGQDVRWGCWGNMKNCEGWAKCDGHTDTQIILYRYYITLYNVMPYITLYNVIEGITLHNVTQCSHYKYAARNRNVSSSAEWPGQDFPKSELAKPCLDHPALARMLVHVRPSYCCSGQPCISWVIVTSGQAAFVCTSGVWDQTATAGRGQNKSHTIQKGITLN